MQKTLRAVDLIVALLRKRIINGDYPIGSRLPAERTLAEELDVNRLTLRAGLRHLEAEGLLKPHHGQGVVVLDYKETGSIDLISYTQKPEYLVEILNLRKILAAEAVAGACTEATINDVNRLHSIQTKQEQTQNDLEFLEGDLYFMRTLVHSSRNFSLKLLFNSFERITRAQPELHKQIVEHKAQACASYQALISLIRNRNETLAKKAILGYLTPSEQEELAAPLSFR